MAFDGKTDWGMMEAYDLHSDSLNSGGFVFIVLSQIVLFFQETVLFIGIEPNTGALFFTSDFTNSNPQLHRFLLMPQAWSLEVELSFYLIAPFILWKSIKVIVGLIIVSVALWLFIYSLGLNQDPWSYRFFSTELLFFLLGAVACQIYLLTHVTQL